MRKNHLTVLVKINSAPRLRHIRQHKGVIIFRIAVIFGRTNLVSAHKHAVVVIVLNHNLQKVIYASNHLGTVLFNNERCIRDSQSYV